MAGLGSNAGPPTVLAGSNVQTSFPSPAKTDTVVPETVAHSPDALLTAIGSTIARHRRQCQCSRCCRGSSAETSSPPVRTCCLLTLTLGAGQVPLCTGKTNEGLAPSSGMKATRQSPSAAVYGPCLENMTSITQASGSWRCDRAATPCPVQRTESCDARKPVSMGSGRRCSDSSAPAFHGALSTSITHRINLISGAASSARESSRFGQRHAVAVRTVAVSDAATLALLRSKADAR